MYLCKYSLYFVFVHILCVFRICAHTWVGVFIAGVVLHHVPPIDAIFPAALHETRPRLLTAKERERKKNLFIAKKRVKTRKGKGPEKEIFLPHRDKI